MRKIIIIGLLLIIGLPVFADISYYYAETGKELKVGDTLWHTGIGYSWIDLAKEPFFTPVTITAIRGNNIWVKWPTNRTYISKKLYDNAFSIFYYQEPEAFKVFFTYPDNQYDLVGRVMFIKLPNGNVTEYHDLTTLYTFFDD
jgi:hypothetical protein